MSKVLVTGAAGFIGFETTKKLLSDGHHVIGLDNFDETLNSNFLRRQKIGHFIHPFFTFLEGDLLNYDLEGLINGVDAVVHFAATPGLLPSWTNFDSYLNNNIMASFKIAEAIQRSQFSRKVIVASTSSVYGELAIGDENATIGPSSPYGITKIASEQIFKTFLDSSDNELYILRLFSVYGPNQREDMAWQKVIRAIMDDSAFPLTARPNHFRTCTYVEDVSELCASIVLNGGIPGTYNICGDEEVNILEGIKTIETLIGKSLKIIESKKRRGDQIRTLGNSSLARMNLNFIPSTNFEVGIQEQINEYLRQKK
jgi:nucleoside-diphosphate-sugar epimerase